MMIKQNALNKSTRYLITASLLNSWLYLFKTSENYYTKTYEDFIKTLSREPIEETPAIIKGREFEDKAYRGEIDYMLPYVNNAEIQVKAKRNLKVDGQEYLIYGICDLLKGGIIYDIKRVREYTRGKYNWSAQHYVYFYLFKGAYEFIYLAIDDYEHLFKEEYFSDSVDVKNFLSQIIRDFINYLKTNNLYDIYIKNWEAK